MKDGRWIVLAELPSLSLASDEKRQAGGVLGCYLS